MKPYIPTDCQHNYGIRLLGSVTVGPKCQILIPKVAREENRLNPGDILLIYLKHDKAIALIPKDRVDSFTERILQELGYKGEGISIFLEKQNVRIMGTIEIGSRGQIIIPKVVREIVNIGPGDILMAHSKYTDALILIPARDVHSFMEMMQEELTHIKNSHATL